MGKYINFNYKYDSSTDNRIHLLEEIGFDGVFIYSQYNPSVYIEKILKSSLKIETLHLPYKKIVNGKCVDSKHVNVLWSGGYEADCYTQSLINEIRFANSYGIKSVVMHVTGGDNPPMIKQGSIQYFEKILNECEKLGIVLCLENLRRLDYLEYIFDNLKSQYLKFCFDSGHANSMTKNIENFPWEYLGNKLHCLHLNDNDGSNDSHCIPLDGNIDWVQLIKTIHVYNNKLPLTLEVRASDMYKKKYSEKEYLQRCWMCLSEFEKTRSEKCCNNEDRRIFNQ